MRGFHLAFTAILSGFAVAKECMDVTVPISIAARTAKFNVPIPQTNLDATLFIQNITQQGRNFTEASLEGYTTTSGTYEISAQFCAPSASNATHPAVQVLTHGIGFDKGYWDSPYNNFNYSYVNVATDQYKYFTLAYDRLGIGKSSHGEPLNEIQAPLEIAALAQLSLMLRNGSFPGVHKTFSKVIHVGHSFGSAQTYSLVNMYPNISDGIILTGFAMNASFLGYFAAGANFVLANQNQPYRLGSTEDGPDGKFVKRHGWNGSMSEPSASERLNYANGYLASSDINTNQYVFFLPGYFDSGAMEFGENSKQPATLGELLTLGSVPGTNSYSGPVLVITGSHDLPFCGGDCLTTGDPSVPSIPSTMAKSFLNAKDNFTAYIQPNTGHGMNFHYNATGAYHVINHFLRSKGLVST